MRARSVTGVAAVLGLVVVVLGGCGPDGAASARASDADFELNPTAEAVQAASPAAEPSSAPGRSVQEAPRDTAVFAGGCFWCMEPPYDDLEGVLSTVSGYAGGDVVDPTYEQVLSGGTGHREVIRVIWNPEEVGYDRLLDVFWRNVDPLDGGGQFCDRGFQYTSAIYARDSIQARKARASLQEVQGHLEGEIATEIVTEPAPFYRAEDYHQDYYQENPVRYKFYRWNCGRDARLEEVWGESPTS
jgi:peptide-methionine (S)-S-oxide reductase